MFQSLVILKNYQKKNVKETPSSHGAHMGVSFFHDYCNSFLCPHSAQSQICCDKEAAPPVEALPADLLEHKRTDLMVEHEVVVKGNLYYER